LHGFIVVTYSGLNLISVFVNIASILLCAVEFAKGPSRPGVCVLQTGGGSGRAVVSFNLFRHLFDVLHEIKGVSGIVGRACFPFLPKLLIVLVNAGVEALRSSSGLLDGIVVVVGCVFEVTLRLIDKVAIPGTPKTIQPVTRFLE
jgi:hypothetical protein